ncbi:hypothetical protein JGG62_24785, partial [Salmonella enterica subsp. enterica serovar Typhimurium]|nr:hypothetical protein [Salmonella enterica subsp. enterica serovar Typhimurium]
MTIDETWLSLHQPPEKDQAKQWLGTNKQRPTVARPNTPGPKLMLKLAMDYDGIGY